MTAGTIALCVGWFLWFTMVFCLTMAAIKKSKSK